MKWWQTAWALAKDLCLTGTGLTIIILQIFAKQPNDVLLVTGLTLTVPSAASHAGALLSGPQSTRAPGPGPSSSPSPPPPARPSRSSPPPGEPGE